MADVHPFWALLIGLAAGVIAGVLIMIAARRISAGRPIPQLDPLAPPPTVPDEVADLVGVLHALAMVVGPHDEVLCANRVAVGSPLMRGSRIHDEQLLALVREVRRTRELAAADLEVPRGRGHATVHYSVRVATLSTELVIALAEDRSAARRIDDVRRDFVANVSHELKTPIGAIALLSEAVEDAADDPEAVRRFASRMGKESTRLSDLVRQIIELSRLQSLDPLTHGDVVDMDTLFADVVDRVKVDAEARGISLRAAGERRLTVYGDRSQLTTALANLVENAVIYSDTGAKVVVSARRHGVDDASPAGSGDESLVEISVSDNGIGIPPEEQQRIFERFYRVDYARSRANGGTGLGLSIVKHVAAAHGGSIDVWSQPGEGSTFTLRIPDHPELAQRRASDPDPQVGRVHQVQHDQQDQEVRL